MDKLNRLITILRTNSKTYLLATLGFISLLCMLYIRFIRERLPQDIPFQLTELRFYAILIICVSFLYIIKLNLKPKMPNEYIQKLVAYISLPFTSFDNLLKTNKYSISNIKSFLKYSYPKTYLAQMRVIIILQLIPRIILLLVFLLDVFYFHKLYYFYIIIGIGIFPWLYNYHKYSMYHARELGIVYLEAICSKVTIFEKGWADVEQLYDYDEWGDWVQVREWEPHPRNKYHDKYVTIREYFQIVLEKEVDDYENDYTDDDNYDFEPSPMPTRQRFKQYKELTGKTELTEEDYDILDKDFKEISPILSNLYYRLHYLPIWEQKYHMPKINLIMVILWFLGWSYILIKSFHTLQDISMTLKILESVTIYLKEMNPFSNP